MKRLLFIICFTSLLLNLFAVPRGTTQQELPQSSVVVGQAQPYYPTPENSPAMPNNNPGRNVWLPVDSLQLNTIIRAGNQYGMKFSSANQTMQLCSSMGDLTPPAQQAVNKSPVWMQADLQNVLSQLNADKQQIWSDIINSAVDPYIDEIAFSVAHTSVQFLASNYSDPVIYTENAQSLYSIDSELSYVQIVNHGSSTTDPEYYSTTSYYKTTADSQIVQVEVPRDIYYWYIVHPKITDEIPAYIDPSIVESNAAHSNNLSLPPEGKFWRSYLYNVQENAYPVLRDTLIECQTAFNRNGTAGDAIRAIQWWINHTMNFNSNNERPHQPVRIYKKHMGRCGEYADYTSAACRAALIPCTSILSVSTDHTWNEFWEDGWVQWEPVNGYINTPLVYEDGWSKVFGSVFEIRSDGYLSSVTDRYSAGHASITIAVKDILNNPVDGSRVILATYDSLAGIVFDMAGFTDNAGLVTFVVGENRHYYARVESALGNYPLPSGAFQSLVDSSVNGEQYSFQMVYPNQKQLPQISQIQVPTDTVEDWRFAIEFNSPNQILYGKVTWDDLSANGTAPYFYHTLNVPGKVNLIMTDEENYIFYNTGHFGDAFNVMTDVSSGAALFNLPVDSNWYAFLDNSNQLNNAQLVTGVMLYQNFGVANEDQTEPNAGIYLYPNYPNPFNQETTVSFNLPKTAKAEISIYNIKGQRVKTLSNPISKSGLNSVTWDGKDYTDKQVSNGVYYFKLSAAGKTIKRKMVLLR